MILTESDLHAYNRGELPPEAVLALEADPLAIQDAARLRAIGEALREEVPITVIGRAETLERLRPRSRVRIGVPYWVWGVGTACVFGLVMLSVPNEPQPTVRYVAAIYEPGKSEAREIAPPAADASTVGVSAAEAEAKSAAAPASVLGRAENADRMAGTASPTPSAGASRLQPQSRARMSKPSAPQREVPAASPPSRPPVATEAQRTSVAVVPPKENPVLRRAARAAVLLGYSAPIWVPVLAFLAWRYRRR